MQYTGTMEVHFDKNGLMSYMEDTSARWLNDYFKENPNYLPGVLSALNEKIKPSITGTIVNITFIYDDIYLETNYNMREMNHRMIYDSPKDIAVDGIKVTIMQRKTNDIKHWEVEEIKKKDIAEMELQMKFKKEASENLYEWSGYMNFDETKFHADNIDPTKFVPQLITNIEEYLNRNTYPEGEEKYFEKNPSTIQVNAYLKNGEVSFYTIDGRPIKFLSV